MTAHTRLLAGALLATAIVTAACGGGGRPTGVASLAGGHTTTTVKKSKAAAKQEMQDAALAFAKCMREHGVDMPDPKFSDNGSSGGGFMIAQGGPGGQRPDDATAKASQDACQPIMDKAQQDMPQPSPAEQAKMRDQALKFARCMRQHGIDMPDPTFDSNGGAQIHMGTAGSGDTAGNGPVTAGNGAAPPPPGDNAKMDAAAKACGGPGKGGFAVSGGDK